MITNLTLKQLFGDSASQDTEILRIAKADLPGLTVRANNRAEQLLVALLLKAQTAFEGYLTDELHRTIVDERGSPLTYQNQVWEKLNLSFWRRHFVGNDYIVDTLILQIFFKPLTSNTSPIQPNLLDY